MADTGNYSVLGTCPWFYYTHFFSRGCGLFALPLVAEQIGMLSRKLAAYIQMLAVKSGVDLRNIGRELEGLIGKVNEPRKVVQEILARAGQALGVTHRVVGLTIYVTVTVAMIPIYFFFFVWKFDQSLRWLGEFIPISKRERILDIVKKMDRATASFFRGRLFIALCMFVMFSVGWFFADVPYWFLLGMIAGFMTIVPYASVIFWPIAVALKYVEALAGGAGADFVSIVVWPSAVYLGVQLLEGWFLTPYVQSGQTEMSVPTILMVAFVGGTLGGFLGLFLAIPIAACIKIVMQEIVIPPARRWANEEQS